MSEIDPGEAQTELNALEAFENSNGMNYFYEIIREKRGAALFNATRHPNPEIREEARVVYNTLCDIFEWFEERKEALKKTATMPGKPLPEDSSKT
jgi:hypothetical protein